MKSFKLKTIIVLILVNITTIYAVIQMENIKENKNIIIDINGNGDIFDNNFYNLIIYGPSSSVSSSAGESILYSNFKQLEQEIYNILKDEISNQFESIFINQILKQARKNKIENGLFDSEAISTFNSMIDEQYSEILSKKTNFGISDALFNQFKSQVVNERE